MEETPPLVRQDDKDIEDSKCHGRHNEEICGDQLLRVIIQESPPGLGGWLSLVSHVLSHRGLAHLDTEL